MNVPKCKECKDLFQYDIGKHTYSECYNDTTIAAWGMGARKIYSVCLKTSPKWCPLRKGDDK